MNQPGWVTKMHARAALRNGRPEEAHQLLDALLKTGDRRAWALREDVLQGYLQRANDCLTRKAYDSVYRDLEQLEKLAPGEKPVLDLRERYHNALLQVVRQLLDDGQPVEALLSLHRVKDQIGASAEFIVLEMAAQEWVAAEDLTERGEFAQALTAVEKCRRKLVASPQALERFEQEIHRRKKSFRDVFEELQGGLGGLIKGDPKTLLEKADAALAAAPRHRDVQQIRTRAWQSVQMETQAQRDAPTPLQVPALPLAASLAKDTNQPEPPPHRKSYLWIDAVGGYLVTWQTQLTIGQATQEGGPIDIPLLADVSRFHARLKREEDAYILESSQNLTVNGRAVERATVLKHNDRVRLSESCEMVFTLPVPGSSSAVIIFTGGRRLPQAVDAVLLLGDMLVLGRGDKTHVRMDELEQPLRLSRQKDRLMLQWPGDFYIDGEKVTQKAALPVAGSAYNTSFALAVEPVPIPSRGNTPRSAGGET